MLNVRACIPCAKPPLKDLFLSPVLHNSPETSLAVIGKNNQSRRKEKIGDVDIKPAALGTTLRSVHFPIKIPCLCGVSDKQGTTDQSENLCLQQSGCHLSFTRSYVCVYGSEEPTAIPARAGRWTTYHRVPSHESM